VPLARWTQARKHCRRSLLDLSSRKSKDPDALLRKPSGPTLILLGLVVVDRTIHFDAEPGAGAVEVEDEWTDRVLAPEVQAGIVSPEQRPEQHLRLRHRLAVRLGSFADEIGRSQGRLRAWGTPLHHAMRGPPPPQAGEDRRLRYRRPFPLPFTGEGDRRRRWRGVRLAQWRARTAAGLACGDEAVMGRRTNQKTA
jgi:hypothetical protein